MLKSKVVILLLGIIIAVLFLKPLDTKAVNIVNQDFYDSYNTLLAPYASKAIRKKLGPNHQYSLTDAKILKVERFPKENFSFIVTVQYKTYTGAHNPPNGIETVTFNIDPSGVKVINFVHKDA
ncbi:DUF3888 domain-containing protein [Bacillus toyonensis]|uniref:DUF3888 domain-containing protein n=1 Tax=Bacillus TaxID=1386 RepID=UPI0001A0AECD|nr:MULTISPECIES: DUF3888 domain-containing protein [Bacillus cereus group]EEL37375.1 hypothetical protein bcere0020_52040 [Bacillus cereus Rock3-29]KAB0447707.1 DUF3888 domain-containing protein [Lysinibacillus sp. VIA-II-2016]EJV42372.1 hypothetical protein IEK_05701 [Bacillus toyonensis]PED58200.1 DUF3888 domain-containing protein [Bacillus toyonensis]PEN40408.1 DUF3888 domain-containing protein [Bacillus toyonensis]